ncbi:MAG: ArnT family glycosyltransferase [Candidatus Sumerlaeaceae bacterium]
MTIDSLTRSSTVGARLSHPVWLGIIICVIYLVGISNRSFWAENEAYYALGARSVLDGHWLLPVIYNDTVADKPPLVFWAVALVSALLGGVSEFSARVTNLIPSMLVLFYIYRFAKTYLGGARPAIFATVILATSREFFQIATEVNTDTFLLALLFVSWSAIYEVMEVGFTWRRWAFVWGAMSLAMLTKGPVAPVLSALVAATFALSRYGWREGWRRTWSLRPLPGAVLCFVPFALWCLMVWKSYGTPPLETILLKHNMQRFVKAFDHNEAWYYYFAKLPIVLLPWSLVLPVAAWQLWKRRAAGVRPEPWLTFSLCATAAVFVFFSLSSSKRQYYLLPLMPWLALVIADSVHRLGERTAPRADAYRRIVGFTAPVALALLGLYFAVVYPLLEVRRSPHRLVQEVEHAVDRDDGLLIFAEEDPRLMYYVHEKFSYLGETPADLKSVKALLSSRAEIDVLLPRRSLKLMKEVASVPLYVEADGTYRDNRYYILTTENGANRPAFTDAFIRAQVNPGKKAKSAIRD